MAYNYKKQEDDAVRQIATNSVSANANSFDGNYDNAINGVLGKILNREKFTYDLNGDALYNQYKEKYIQQGKLAMADTVGQASALTGGYGNSWATTAGYQAYQNSLQNLNDIVPQLYQMAYDRYNQEGQDLINQYNVLGNQSDRMYQRDRDAVADAQWQKQFDRSVYESDRDYDRAVKEYDDKIAYQQARDAADYDRWQKQFDRDAYEYDQNLAYKREQDAVSADQWQQNFDRNAYENDRDYQRAVDEFNTNLAYKQYRDATSDAQWQKNFDRNAFESDRDYQRAVDEFNTNLAYKQARDAVSDRQWQANFDQNAYEYASDLAYKQLRDSISDQQWQANFDRGNYEFDANLAYKQARDAVSDQQWQNEYDISLLKLKDANGDGTVTPGEEPSISSYDFSDWTASDFVTYLSEIRHAKGEAAAKAELNELIKAGAVTNDMMGALGIAAQGGFGHKEDKQATKTNDEPEETEEEKKKRKSQNREALNTIGRMTY